MLLGPLASVALLLVAAGASKLRAPAAAAAALASLGVASRSSRPLARALGLAEVAVGFSVLLSGRRVALVTLLLAQLGFVAVTAVLLRRPLVPCGCFGAPHAPATRAGLATNALATAVVAAAVFAPPAPLAETLIDQPLAAATVTLLSATAAWLVHALHSARPTRTAVT